MNFTRGQDPKEAIGIGRDAILKEIGGIILDKSGIGWTHKDLDVDLEEDQVSKYNFKDKNVIIGISPGNPTMYIILKNRIKYDGPKEGDEKDLIYVLLKLQEAFRKYGLPEFDFPLAQKVFARTIGIDLVPVIPMSMPSGVSLYLDYKYKKQNIIQKIFKRIFLTKPSKKPNI